MTRPAHGSGRSPTPALRSPLADRVINEQTGTVEEFEFGHQHEGVTTRWSRVSCDPDVAIGDDAVIVPADAVS